MPAKASPTTSKSQADKCGKHLREYINGRADFETDEQFKYVLQTVSAWRSMHEYPLRLVTPGVRNWVSQETSGRITVAQRLKRWDRIVMKLDRFPSMRLSQMEDIAGCRAVLANPDEVEAVARRIRAKWVVREESDYREHGKPDTGYRGLHITVVRRERAVEVQLRTAGQHYWAEQVERTSSRTEFSMKDGEAPPDLLDYFKVASHLTWQRENGQQLDRGLQRRLSHLRDEVRPYFSERRR
jgi:ppGpp synthetase/RelA/SpoT-type nucleotidyltranferase